MIDGVTRDGQFFPSVTPLSNPRVKLETYRYCRRRDHGLHRACGSRRRYRDRL